MQKHAFKTFISNQSGGGVEETGIITLRGSRWALRHRFKCLHFRPPLPNRTEVELSGNRISRLDSTPEFSIYWLMHVWKRQCSKKCARAHSRNRNELLHTHEIRSLLGYLMMMISSLNLCVCSEEVSHAATWKKLARYSIPTIELNRRWRNILGRWSRFMVPVLPLPGKRTRWITIISLASQMKVVYYVLFLLPEAAPNISVTQNLGIRQVGGLRLRPELVWPPAHPEVLE